MTTMTDDEREARYEARLRGEEVGPAPQAHAPYVTMMTALDVARHYADGKTIPDDDIRLMREKNPSAWLAACDEFEREHILAKASPAKPAPAPAARGANGVNLSAVTRLLLKTVATIYGVIREDRTAINELARRVQALESAAPRLEARASKIAWRGVWNSAEAYAPGEFATHAGSLWVALAPSQGVRPGTSAAEWQLAVKRGKDAR